MIEILRGIIEEKHPHRVVIWAGPLALEVLIPFSTYGRLPDPGQEATLSCHLHWREEGPQLFGFAGEQERALFRLLTRVNKVGPKLALNILSATTPESLVTMILSEDVQGLTSLKGVGSKLASRLIVELRDPLAESGLPQDGPDRPPTRAQPTIPHETDVREALLNLGYTTREIRVALQQVAPTLPPDPPLQAVLEAVLRSFSKK